MLLCKTGGIIAAASRRVSEPLLQMGQVPVVRRSVIAMQQAGLFPIVVITGAQTDDVRDELANYGVIFVENERAEAPELIDSVRLGLRRLQGKCERVAFAPVNVPMYTPATLRTLMAAEGGFVVPRYRGRGGHPVLISADQFSYLLDYTGPDGLRGAMAGRAGARTFVDVEDEGVVLSVHNPAELGGYLDTHNREILHPVVRVTLERESAFFTPRAKLLLLLIADTHSVRSACAEMALSYSKAWDMVNYMEAELGYPLVARRHGGSHGGRTDLTERGALFLRTWHQLETEVMDHCQDRFDRLFRDSGVL